MAYPRKPKGENPNAGEGGQPMSAQPVGTPTPMVPQVPGVQGGAPKLTIVNTPAAPAYTVGGDPGRSTTENFNRTVKEFWKGQQHGETPSTNLALHPASPWKPEELDQKWGPMVTELEKKLWDRYSSLPPEQQAQAHWQQVAINAQQVARSLTTRMMQNAIGQEAPQMEATSHNRLAQMDIRQWLAALPKKG